MLPLKRLLPALALVAAFSASVASADFADVAPSHPNAEAIRSLEQSEIVSGYPDGYYRPDHLINRAEFVKIIIASIASRAEIRETVARTQITEFPDVPTAAWFSDYVYYATLKGIINGYPDRTFRPDWTINFAEAAKILILSYDVPYRRDGGPWWWPYVAAMYQRQAFPDSYSGDPAQFVTRGEMAEMVLRLRPPPPPPPPRLGCDDLMDVYKRTVEENRACRTDADCVLYSASCPFLTCGTSVNRGGLPSVRDAGVAYLSCLEGSGQPIPCAGCAEIGVACVAGTCVEQEPLPLEIGGDCVIGGCSGQLCTEEGEDAITTCEWRDEYACFRHAVCERQGSGACGWTETDAYRSCLDDMRSP